MTLLKSLLKCTAVVQTKIKCCIYRRIIRFQRRFRNELQSQCQKVWEWSESFPNNNWTINISKRTKTHSSIQEVPNKHRIMWVCLQTLLLRLTEEMPESSRKTSAELMFKVGRLGRTQCFQREAVWASVKDWSERTDRTTACLPPAGYKGWGKPNGKDSRQHCKGLQVQFKVEVIWTALYNELNFFSYCHWS